jgi:hypothetical protein
MPFETDIGEGQLCNFFVSKKTITSGCCKRRTEVASGGQEELMNRRAGGCQPLREVARDTSKRVAHEVGHSCTSPAFMADQQGEALTSCTGM